MKKNAINNPVIITKESENTSNMKVGGPGIVTSSDAGLVQAKASDIETEAFKEKMANEAFLNEIVTVMVNKTTEKNANQEVEIWVNGVLQKFTRGVKVSCKRRFVEGLARAKQTGYKCEEYEEDRITKYRYPTDTGLRYNFTVTEDPRGELGNRWLQSVLAQP